MKRKEQYADEIIELMELMKQGAWASYIDKPTKDAVIEVCQNCVESWCGRHADHVKTDVRAIRESEQTEPKKFAPDIENGFIRPQTDCGWK